MHIYNNIAVEYLIIYWIIWPTVVQTDENNDLAWDTSLPT